MPLVVTLGSASDPGPRERNEDFFIAVTPQGPELAAKGMLLAVADGVSGNAGGREASEALLRTLAADYYTTPDTWSTAHALETVIQAANRWILAQAVARPELAGMSSTLSALVLHGTRYTLAQVGDSRIYLLRGTRFEQLTTDHVWERPDMRHVLKRAVGLDRFLDVDYAEGELCAGDEFLLVSDGVWEPLQTLGLHERLLLHREPEYAAAALVREALARRGGDNATALVVRVDGLPDETLTDALDQNRELAALPRLKPGMNWDGMEVLAVLHESRATLLYKVREPDSGRQCVLKTLNPLAEDAAARVAFAQEAWLARRVQSHYFPQAVKPARMPAGLYYLMSWHEGATLQQHLDRGRHFAPAEVAQFGIRLLKGLGALHRLNIVHRDIKPANLHWGQDERLRLLDFGVALCPGVLERPAGKAGTPSYLAPELHAGAEATPASDLYAAGVTLYHLLTRRYPYGEIEPFQHPRFGAPVPPSRYRPDGPGWLEHVLLKAVAVAPSERFETAEEFRLALERGGAQPLAAPRPHPLLKRQGLWPVVALLSLLLNLLLAWLLLR